MTTVTGDVIESGGSSDRSFSERVKALSLTRPLHELDERKGLVTWADAKVYPMAELALHAIDIVAIAQDFETGAGHDHVIERLSEHARQIAPDRSVNEWADVARWVLNGLLNAQHIERGFTSSYGVTSDEGRHVRLDFRFRLLEEQRDERGGLVLRASNEALNVLVGALDTDVESAQIAAEVRLRNLIKRGRLQDAKLVAEQARIRTIQFGEEIRARLDATRRNVWSVDWMETMPGLLDEALEHVEERVVMERGIAAQITRTRDEADDPVLKRVAAELVDIVEDCVRRHTILQRRLIGARAVFREEQDRQEFSGRPNGLGIDLYGGLLKPLMALSVSEAAEPVARFFVASSGPEADAPVHLAGLVRLLFDPPAERPRHAEPVPEPEFAPLPEASGFSDAEWDAAERLLDLPGRTRRLSDLLAEAAESDLENLPDLVALLAQHAFAPEARSSVRRGDHRLRLSVPTDTPLDVPGFGGDDLLVTSALIERNDERAGER
ncbi:hypothetical protein GCM10022254_41230 [Actinomadura meridiana]|uniref:DUF3375 domain-containing protein n=1 Tax=Actinomadura meridiana TaxID=559626 RepID=A0ABP8C7J4_9ACTN